MDGLLDQIFSEDPYLAFQPAFAYTLPIQLLVSGITLTLLCVLAIHLIFTTQYHYPLAPLNYILQFFSILTVLISVFIRIIVILQHSGDSADTWPYSLDYVSVAIPPKSWSLGQDGAWFLLQGLNSGFANLAHIQFLTLLYPSRTEARLIVFVLGPLALASAFLVFTALSPSQTVLDLGDAIRNVFNSTLLLIFTIALLIWGLVVNRRRAWRTDGGTAIFGSAAIFLATVNTACNFVAVKEDGIDWLQHLLYCSILWQTWLGWWWWVGSGMGIGEVEDIMERQERKKKRLAKKAAKQRSQNKNKRSASGQGGSSTGRVGELGQASAVAMAGFTSSVTGILRGRTNTLLRRRGSAHEGEEGDRGETGRENIELEDMPSPSRRRNTRLARTGTTSTTAPSGTGTRNGTGPVGVGESTTTPTPQVGFSASTHSGSQGRNHLSSNSETSSTSHTPSLNPPRTVGQFLSYPTTWLWVYTRQLRRAHEDAAKKQAIERAERRQKVFGEHGPGKERSRTRGSADEAELGWGLGAFGIREHEEGERRLQEAGERLRDDRLLPNAAEPGASDASEALAGRAEGERAERVEGHGVEQTGVAGEQVELAPAIQAAPAQPSDQTGDPGPSTLTQRSRSQSQSQSRPAQPRQDTNTSTSTTARPRRTGNGGREDEWIDLDEGDGSDDTDSSENEDGGWTMWGPLKRWRRADKAKF